MASSKPTFSPAILIVEDEPLLMMDAVDIIEDAGFRAYEATSVKQAIKILEEANDIVVVFTDVNLAGGTDGLELARLIRERWPPIKLLVSSGRVVLHEEDLPAAALFLPKPYQAKQVHDMVQQLLQVVT